MAAAIAIARPHDSIDLTAHYAPLEGAPVGDNIEDRLPVANLIAPIGTSRPLSERDVVDLSGNPDPSANNITVAKIACCILGCLAANAVGAVLMCGTPSC
ncbi:MAG: hypothetical protein WCG14_01380 [Chlamydiia bacterium]